MKNVASKQIRMQLYFNWSSRFVQIKKNTGFMNIWRGLFDWFVNMDRREKCHLKMQNPIFCKKSDVFFQAIPKRVQNYFVYILFHHTKHKNSRVAYKTNTGPNAPRVFYYTVNINFGFAIPKQSTIQIFTEFRIIFLKIWKLPKFE
jgi:hypothetical protein